MKRQFLMGVFALAAAFALPSQAQQKITLHGASQFGEDHAFTLAFSLRPV